MSESQRKIVPADWSIHPLIDANDEARLSCYRYVDEGISSRQTRKTYKSALKRIIAYWADMGVEDLLDLQSSHIRDYIELLEDANKKAAAKTAFYASKGFLQRCVEDGLITVNPAGSLKQKFEVAKKNETAILSPKDILALINSIPCRLDNDFKDTDLRDRALISLMAYTFVRIGGALSARRKDFYHDRGRYWLDMTEKGGKPHTVPLPASVSDCILEYIETAGIKDNRAWLFQSANRNAKMTGKPYDRDNSRKMIRDRSILIFGGDRRVKNHTLRASGITQAFIQGIPAEIIKEMCNHKDIQTTQIYDHSGIDRVASVMDNFDYNPED